MNNRLLKRLAIAGAITVSGTMLLGTGVASAAGSTPDGVGPQWNTHVGVQIDRSAGSETTYYLMARLGDLYTQTSIYGCVVDPAVDNRTCEDGNGGETFSNGSATDTLDDYSRAEIDNGLGIGSGGGLAQLCNIVSGSATATTGGDPIPDFARTSRAAKTTEVGGNCPSPGSPSTGVNSGFSGPAGLLYADDAVVGVDFKFQGSSAITCTTGVTCTATQIGPVADGWVPGNAFGGPYTNHAVTDLDNIATDTVSPNTSSILYRLQCATQLTNTLGSGGTDDPLQDRIYDWGQLTDPTATTQTLTFTGSDGASHTTPPLTKGQLGEGAPIGVPIFVPFVNTSSGTESTWQGLSKCANVDTNGNSTNVVQENDGPQLNDIGLLGGAGTATYLQSQYQTGDPANSLLSTVQGFFPASAPAGDNIYADNLVAASIYYISYGVSVAFPHTLASGSYAGAFAGSRTSINFESVSQTDETKSTCTLANSCGLIASNRQLFNYVNPNNLRASALGFLDWICNVDGGLNNTVGNVVATNHGTDLTTGKNYAAELSSTIGTQFFFPREDCYTSAGASATGGTAAQSLTPTSLTT